jgi:hypothetical protein
MKGTLGVCLITQAQALFDDVAFVVEQLQAGMSPVAMEPWSAQPAAVEE